MSFQRDSILVLELIDIELLKVFLILFSKWVIIILICRRFIRFLLKHVNMVVDNVQGNIVSELPTIPQLLHNSLSKCDPDLRPILQSNVVLTGGQTVL
jgi:hypothetical protein